jgi:hypothetical protein
MNEYTRGRRSRRLPLSLAILTILHAGVLCAQAPTKLNDPEMPAARVARVLVTNQIHHRTGDAIGPIDVQAHPEVDHCAVYLTNQYFRRYGWQAPDRSWQTDQHRLRANLEHLVPDVGATGIAVIDKEDHDDATGRGPIHLWPAFADMESVSILEADVAQVRLLRPGLRIGLYDFPPGVWPEFRVALPDGSVGWQPEVVRLAQRVDVWCPAAYVQRDAGYTRRVLKHLAQCVSMRRELGLEGEVEIYAHVTDTWAKDDGRQMTYAEWELYLARVLACDYDVSVKEPLHRQLDGVIWWRDGIQADQRYLDIAQDLCAP